MESIGKFPPHPLAKKIEFPTRGFATHGKFSFASGFGGNFPIPSRHIQAIVSMCSKIITMVPTFPASTIICLLNNDFNNTDMFSLGGFNKYVNFLGCAVSQDKPITQTGLRVLSLHLLRPGQITKFPSAKINNKTKI